MKHVSKITAITETKNYPLGALTLSKLNPRQIINDNGIEGLAASIKYAGLLQNLAGLKVGNKIEIVAGGRRLRAFQLLAKDKSFSMPSIPVKVTEDEGTAVEWAQTENSQRLDLHPVDKILSYGEMRERHFSNEQIAVIYGTSEQDVYKYLALAGLPNEVLEGMKKGTITVAKAKIFTLGTDVEKISAIAKRMNDGERMSDYMLQQEVTPEVPSMSDYRTKFVGIEVYEKAGGTTQSDLFSDDDDKYLLMPDLLDKLAQKQLETHKKQFLKDGYKWVEIYIGHPNGASEVFQDNAMLKRIPPKLSKKDEARFQELRETRWDDDFTDENEVELSAFQKANIGEYSQEQKALSGILIYIDWQGKASSIEAIVNADDTDAAIDAGFIPKPEKNDKTPSLAFTNALSMDLDRAKNTALQTSFLDKTDLLLDVLAYQLGNHYEGSSPMAFSESIVDNQPSTETGFVKDDRLQQPANSWSRGEGEAMTFAEFKEKGTKHRNKVLADNLAKLIKFNNDDLSMELAAITGAKLRDVFTPTYENFHKRVNAGLLVKFYTEIMGKHADPSFAGWKKKAQAETMDKLFNDETTQKALPKGILDRIKIWEPKG